MARILIAEDEEALRELCARALATDGHEVETACDGGDALDVIAPRGAIRSPAHRHPHTDHERDRARAERGVGLPAVTILLMTACADQRERAHRLDAIIHDVISKPFIVSTLRSTVNEALVTRTRH